MWLYRNTQEYGVKENWITTVLENLSRNRMQRIRAASLVEQAASGMQIVTLMICGKRQMEIPSKYRANIYAYLFIGMED